MNSEGLFFVDLFAGCGGFSLGLEQAGFTPVYVNELNPDARDTYIANRQDEFPWLKKPSKDDKDLGSFCSADIRDLASSKERLKQLKQTLRRKFGIGNKSLDLVVGGPPCQGFSGIGHRRSYSVDKAKLPSNHLFQEMAKIIAALKPKIFIFENVQGLLTSRWTDNGSKGEIWNEVKAAFIRLGEYSLASELVYAKDYGVPQNRPRVLLVGIRSDLLVKVRGKTVSLRPTTQQELIAIDGSAISKGLLPRGRKRRSPDLVDILGDLVDPDYQNGGATLTYPCKAVSRIQKRLRTSRRGDKFYKTSHAVTEHQYSKHSDALVTKFQAMIDGKDYRKTKKFSQRVLPAKWKEAGPNITATSLPDDYVHFCQPRTLTVREWARLQGFPDWYEFCGKRTTGGTRRAGNPRTGEHFRELPKYTQIGNAVPVPLAAAIGKHLAKLLRG